MLVLGHGAQISQARAQTNGYVQGPVTFLEGPEKFSGPESHNKNLKP